MIITVNMKCPDALYYACKDAAPDKETAKELEDIISSQWMACGEYLSVRFDTEAGTAEVIKRT